MDITVQNDEDRGGTTDLDTTTPLIVNTYDTRHVQYSTQANYLAPNGEAYGPYNLSLLSAGLVSNNPFATARGPVVGGQRPSSNKYYIDGIDYLGAKRVHIRGAMVNNIGLSPLAGSRDFLIPGTASFANPGLAFPSNARTLQVGLRLLF